LLGSLLDYVPLENQRDFARGDMLLVCRLMWKEYASVRALRPFDGLRVED